MVVPMEIRVRRLSLLTMMACGVATSTAEAQVYAPQANVGATSGNPFRALRTMPAAPVERRFDDRVAPASFEQSVGVATPVAAPVATPTPSVAPAAFIPPVNAQPLVASPPAVPNPTMASPSPVQQPAATGTALLLQRAVGADGSPLEHPLAPVVRWAEAALRQTNGLHDYACTFSKREFVDGRLGEQQVMYAKVRQQPYSVYLQFLAPNDVKGQEALYVAGRNNGNLLAHPVGLKQAIVGTLSLAPNDPQAMDGNRYPITDFGMRRLLERYLEAAVVESQFGESDVRIIERARVNNRACTCIQVTHPQPRREFRYQMTRLYVDDEWNLPIRYESYDWPRRQGEAPQLVEEYTFGNVQLNIGLGDADFDPRNPNYRFN